MADKNKDMDRLRLLLRQVELPEPPAGFTDEVMNETAPQTERTQTEGYLQKILQEIPLTQPPSNFTYNVQKAIREQSPVRAKPVITKGAWIVICLFLLACIVMPLFFPASPTPTNAPVYFSWLATRVVHFTSVFREPLLYAEVIVFSSALLLGIERIVRKRVQWKR